MFSLIGKCDKKYLETSEINKRCERAGEDLGSDWVLEWVLMEAGIRSQGHDPWGWGVAEKGSFTQGASKGYGF